MTDEETKRLHEAARAAAQAEYACDDIEVPDEGRVYLACDFEDSGQRGAWVEALVWVSHLPTDTPTTTEE